MYVDKSSIQAEYLRNMLLWLTSPYRLRQGEVTKVYNTLERWVQYCMVVKPAHPEDPAADGQFGINLGKDQPPCPIEQNNFNCPPANCRVLETSKLAERIRHELVELDTVLQRAETGWQRARRSADDYYLDSVALNLHGFYNGLERIFELIATVIDGDRPTGRNWHQAL